MGASLTGDKNPAWRGGHAGYRGPSWPAARRAVYERDGRQCVKCGATSDLTVHHLTPFRVFTRHEEANALDNLAVYCRRCNTEEDNAFWAAHPDLLTSARASFPDCRIRRTCNTCGQVFEGAPRAERCEACCTHKCGWCGGTFLSRKRRAVRFCSRDCNIAFRKSERVYPHACLDCGATIRTGRFRCITCHRADPSREVRPGRKPGRPRKDPTAA